MSAALALLLAVTVRTVEHVSGVALAAALLALFALLALALARWNDDEPRPGYVELHIEAKDNASEPLARASVAVWRAAAQESIARSRSRRKP